MLFCLQCNMCKVVASACPECKALVYFFSGLWKAAAFLSDLGLEDALLQQGWLLQERWQLAGGKDGVLGACVFPSCLRMARGFPHSSPPETVPVGLRSW